jgi:hypothetical protein
LYRSRQHTRKPGIAGQQRGFLQKISSGIHNANSIP